VSGDDFYDKRSRIAGIDAPLFDEGVHVSDPAALVILGAILVELRAIHEQLASMTDNDSDTTRRDVK